MGEIKCIAKISLQQVLLLKKRDVTLWKAPVKEWIHDMYDKRQEKSRKKAERKTKGKNNI